MRLARFLDGSTPRIGVIRGETLYPTDALAVVSWLAAGRPAPENGGRPLASVKLLAPIERPGKIFGSGINYASHKTENPAAVFPTEPGYFSKLPSSVIGPGDAIVLPFPEAQVDYEVELGVVIGKTARRVSRAQVLDYVLGYTVINDVSARAVQFKEPGAQWITHGKGFDTFCPMGPWITLADEIPDPQRLRVRSYVNGELRQDASTEEMLFPVAVLIEEWSKHITLEMGDVLSTGTPAGCGTFRHPPLWLKPGDQVTVEVDAIGRLTNPVVAGW
ncbi:MAG TPA: fumarylacetoacetate hydrolase family protein [Chloroflexota bacterium]|nr:fumarylacetoacetate hydrolase family protein [Chloroflexota bacterium]